MSKDKLTWYELKKFCNDLTGEQLGYNVKGWGEEKACDIEGVEILEDDFIDPSGEGLEPISIYLNDEYDEDKDWINDEPIMAKKGEPRLIIS